MGIRWYAMVCGAGRLAQVEDCFRRALATEPANTLVHAEYGCLLLRRGVNAPRARRHFEEALLRVDADN